MIIDDKISGLFLAIPLLIILYIVMKIDKHFWNSRIANLFNHPTFRILFMILLFVTVMLSSILWRAYI